MASQDYKAQNIYTFVENTLVDSFLKLARVNVISGKYEFLKKDDTLYDAEYEDIPNMYSYIKKQVSDGLILFDYAEDYLKFSDPEYVQKRVFAGEKRIIQSYKRRSGEGDIWLTFAIIVPHDCTPDNPWVLFSWREADADTTTMLDAVSTLSVMYCKILKINLTTDKFKVVRLDENERETVCYSGISEWLRSFSESGKIFCHDIEIYQQFTDIDHLKDYFKKSRRKISCRYRFKITDDFHWVQLDLVPSIEYTDENQVLILYVKDIHDEYLREMNNLREMENNYIRDPMTQLFNRHKYNEDLEKLYKGNYTCITCLYADVNGLHELNNLLGHQKGDDMLCCVADTLRNYFPNEWLYRIGGDEFVMISTTMTKEKVEQLTADVRSKLSESCYEISVGIESGTSGADINKIIAAAELAMRSDKEIYYEQNDSVRRKHAMDEELERILVRSQDAEYFLKAISKRFAGVYFVNMKLDTIRYIYISEQFTYQMEDADFRYSVALRLYMEKYVKWDYHERFSRFMDYDCLKNDLERNGTVKFSYQKTDDTWMHLSILKIDDRAADKNETLWIFFDDEHQL